MNKAQEVALLSGLVTKDSDGRHFTSKFSIEDIVSLENAGLCEVHRPVHSTGIPYAMEHWSVCVTDLGAELVEAYPEYCIGS